MKKKNIRSNSRRRKIKKLSRIRKGGKWEYTLLEELGFNLYIKILLFKRLGKGMKMKFGVQVVVVDL